MCSAVTVLRVLELIYVYVVASIVYGLFDSSRSCATQAHEVFWTGFEDTLGVVSFTSSVFAAIASCYAQSPKWIVPALLLEVINLGFISKQFTACTDLMAMRAGDTESIVEVGNDVSCSREAGAAIFGVSASARWRLSGPLIFCSNSSSAHPLTLAGVCRNH